MLRTPRLASRSGLASSGTLWLALAGAGAAVFLFFVFPRMASSRAAAPAAKNHLQAPANGASSEAPAPSAAEPLLLPPTLVPDGAAETADAESATLVGSGAALAAPPAALAAAEADTGPKLTYAKREKGKVEPIRPGEARKNQAAQLKAQRERIVEEALARGETPPPARTRSPQQTDPKLEGQGKKKGAGDGTAKGKKRGNAYDRKKKP